MQQPSVSKQANDRPPVQVQPVGGRRSDYPSLYGTRSGAYTYPSWRDLSVTVVGFLRRQPLEIHRGGLSVLLGKLQSLIESIMAVPFVLIARAIRPLVLIRFGGLPTAGMAMVFATEIHLCERDAGLHGPRVLDMFCRGPIVSNQQLKVMWERILYVSRFARAAERVNRFLPGGERNKMPWARVPTDVHGLMPRTKPHLSFTPEEEQRGWVELRALGIPSGVPFLCVNARDPAYKAHIAPHEPKRMQEYRDTDVSTYVPAAEAMIHRGYVAVRMGAIVQKPLRTGNPRIIDYATIARTEFLDVFLCARCRFFLGDSSGLMGLPMIFRRPTAVVNYVSLQYITFNADPQNIFVTKKFWLRAERRLMTFREILESGSGRFLSTAQFERDGIELINNTPEEITAVAVEMDERINGTWQGTAEDDELQERFWALFRGHRKEGTTHVRVGAEFLRQNRALLDS